MSHICGCNTIAILCSNTFVLCVLFKYKQLSYCRGTARHLNSVEIVSAAAQLYKKSHLATRIALSCGIKISPVGSLD